MERHSGEARETDLGDHENEEILLSEVAIFHNFGIIEYLACVGKSATHCEQRSLVHGTKKGWDEEGARIRKLPE